MGGGGLLETSKRGVFVHKCTGSDCSEGSILLYMYCFATINDDCQIGECTHTQILCLVHTCKVLTCNTVRAYSVHQSILVPNQKVFVCSHSVESLSEEVASCTHVPREHQVLFSNSSKYFISPHTALSPEHFSQLLEESGGSRGHAKLYLLPVNLVESDTLTPDYSCLAGLGE